MSGKGAGLFGHLVLERLIKESHETAVEKAKAKLATACYVVLMAVILGGMIAYQALVGEVRLNELVNDEMVPLADFEDVLEFDPICECSQAEVPFGAFAETTAAAHDICGEAQVIYDACAAHPEVEECNGIVRIMALPIYSGIATLCNVSEAALVSAIQDTMTTPLATPVVISRGALQGRVDTALEGLKRRALQTFLGPIRVTDSLNQMERPLTAVTVGADQVQQADKSNCPVSGVAAQATICPDSNDGEPFPFVVQNNALGYAFIGLDQEPPCDCYRDWDCSRAIAPENLKNAVGAKQHCSLLRTLETVPIEVLMSDSARRSLEDEHLEAASAVSAAAGHTGARELAGECCSGKQICRNNFDCFRSSTCCRAAREALGLNEDASKDEAFEAFVGGTITPVTSGPFKAALDQGLVAQLDITHDYASYYESCQPKTCRYFRSEKSTPLEALAEILGLVGGISVVMKALLSALVTCLPASMFGGDKKEAGGARDGMQMT